MLAHKTLYQEAVSDMQEQVTFIEANKFNATVISITHPAVSRAAHVDPDSGICKIGSRACMTLHPTEWHSKFLAKLTENLDLDSEDSEVRQRDTVAFNEEIQYIEHLIQSGHILLKLKLGKRNVNLARNLCKHIKGTVIVEVPISSVEVAKDAWRQDKDPDAESSGPDPWNSWNEFRMHCDFHPQVRLGLELTHDIPSDLEVRRWVGEPIEYLILSTDLFTMNKSHYPVLPVKIQLLIKQFLPICSHFMLKTSSNTKKLVEYADYFDFLMRKYYEVDIMTGFGDLLEIPLQPLYNNLDCYTYDCFEQDPVKYKLYQEAIEQAMRDKTQHDKDRKLVIMIVGAGRGPLVRASINATVNTGVSSKIYVVEKNPAAVVTLRANIDELWPGQDITLFSRDMRDFSPSEKADILVSELLGSFGDNELSPECLDGAQKHLKPDGISIPSNSVSFLNPIMSSKMYNNTREVNRGMSIRGVQPSMSSNFECTYVVLPKNVFHIAEPKEVFVFEHPNRSPVIDNSRFKTVTFTSELDCVLHGFIGYFESVLYGDIKLSIHPFTHTNGMFSWFTFFFPISEPQKVRAGEAIEVNLWRQVSQHQAWYEWSVSKPNITHIHNLNGASCPIYK